MTPQQFVAKWRNANLSERSAYQQHFLDICKLLGQPEPAEADPEGAFYTFERGVRKTVGGNGWADVWMRNHFGWEYKGKHKNLKNAYLQLLEYREDLENPPLLVVCDLDRFEIHTNFTNTPKRIYAFDLTGLAEPANLDLLRRLFTAPESLHPGVMSEAITQEAAARFGDLADRLRLHPGVSAEQVAHFLVKLMFCMFGEDIGLLPPKLFEKIIESGKTKPDALARKLESLFEAMSKGGDFGADEILWFNGGLFADAQVLPLQTEEINILTSINRADWANVEPSIFGTLFERILDPAKRSQIGAHYTSRADIETLLEPVLMAPLRRDWAEVRRRCEEELWPKVETSARRSTKTLRAGGQASKARKAFDRAIQDFAERLHGVTVLDPACGSGNFLYVAIHLLLDLEKEVITYAQSRDLSLLPHVRPTQLSGLEINPYAQQLAQVVIWIGYLQWMHHNGFKMPSDPVLDPIEKIRSMDAILDLSDPDHPKEPEWPKADFIVGNPPFLGDKKMRGELGDDYVTALRKLYADRMPGQSDLCCYWFEKARKQIEKKKTKRAGLLATQGIRGGGNRAVLDRIKESGDIFWAWADRDWILDGATVHVSMVGFDDGSEKCITLDGRPVAFVNSNLTTQANVVLARRLNENMERSFIGVSLHGPFDIDSTSALKFMKEGGNPTGLPNSDVIRPIINATNVSNKQEDRWVIAFPFDTDQNTACFYQNPFEYVQKIVLPVRSQNRRGTYREKWWIHGEARPAMQTAVAKLDRFILTPRVSKHRIFVWQQFPIYPSDAVVVFADTRDSFFGILHSRIHELWARAQGTQVRERESGFRYTPTTCFETFPLPHPTKQQEHAICTAARELDALRNRWLNPPEWTRTEILEFPGSTTGPWARYVADPNPQGIGTVRWPRLVPKDPDAAENLKKRTLTNLYNQRPQWLQNAHAHLDAAVSAAYGWEADLGDEEILERLLKLNLERTNSRNDCP